MEDPSFQPSPEVKPRKDDLHVLHEHTENPRPIPQLIEQLRAQIVEAVQGGAFEQLDVEVQPVRSVLRTETRTIIARASRVEPPYRLRLELSVRSDRDPGRPGADYEVRCQARIGREGERGLRFVDFDDLLPLVSTDGSLALDVDQLRARIARAVATLDGVSQTE